MCQSRIKTVNGSQAIERISVSIAEVAEDPREEEDNSRAVYQIDLNKRIALIEYIEGQSPTIRYQLSNHLGSASLELNATGQIISYEEFHPFGTTSYRSGTNETEVSLKRYKYIGKERDEETGLYYYGARYYAAWIGRFVSVDPLADTFNWLTPYAYAENQPISFLDLDGFQKIYFQKEYRETWKKVLKVLKSDDLLKRELYDPITKDSKKDKVEIYFAAKPQEALDLFVSDSMKGKVKGLHIPNLGETASSIVSVAESIRAGEKPTYETMENVKFQFEVFDKLGLSNEEIALLALKKRQGIKVHVVLISEDQYDFNLVNGKKSLISILNTVAHEVGLHLINDLNGNNILPEDEHLEGFGIRSAYTPEDKDIPRNTKLGGWFFQIIKTVNALDLNK